MKGFRQWRWHLDEVFVKINGERHYLWRAVDHEGEVLEGYVTKKRDKAAALAFLKKALKRHGRAEAWPEVAQPMPELRNSETSCD
jgi:putative transposase